MLSKYSTLKNICDENFYITYTIKVFISSNNGNLGTNKDLKKLETIRHCKNVGCNLITKKISTITFNELEIKRKH